MKAYLVMPRNFKPLYMLYCGVVFENKADAIDHALKLNERWKETGTGYTVVEVEKEG